MITSVIRVGDVRRTREVVSAGRTTTGVVTVMLRFRCIFRFLRYVVRLFDRVYGEFYGVVFRFRLDRAARYFVVVVRACVFELIRPTRRASLQGFYRSHGRRGPRMFVDPFRNKVRDFRSFTINVFREDVRYVRGELIVFVCRRRNAAPHLLVN